MLTLAAAPAASAGTAAVDGGKLSFEAAPGELNRLTVTQAGSDFTLRDTGAAITPGAGCTASGDAVTCSGAESVSALLGDGEDNLELAGSAPLTADGGAGDDVIRGAGGNDRITAGPGNDTAFGAGGVDQLHGVDGTDSLEGGDGNDLLDGGTGPDTLVAGDGGDSVFGGDGDDQLEAGKGVDTLDGGAGNDRLLTAEGEFSGDRENQIKCGAGTDSARVGPADYFVTDCERMDGASIRQAKGGVVPIVVVCPSRCSGTVRIADSKRRITGARGFSGAAGKATRVNVRLSAVEVARLFRLRKVRMNLTVGRAKATFTLLRRV